MRPTIRRIRPLVVGLAAIAISFGLVSVVNTDPPTASSPPVVTTLSGDAGDVAVEADGHVCSPVDDPSAPRVSAPSGFYDDPMEIEVLAAEPDTDLWYTLDGSYPDPAANPEQTRRYEGPLRFADRTLEPNVISTIRTAVDIEAYWAREEGSPTWEIAAPDIHKTNVLRVRGDGAECVAIYFIGPELLRRDLPVVHLATDPVHLFDHDTGIYVPGRAFSTFLTSPGYDATRGPWQIPGNYYLRGRDWERPGEGSPHRSTVLHLFEAGGAQSFATNVGVRIHGGSSRSLPQKSLRLYSRSDYAESRFTHPFFGDDTSAGHRSLILRNAGNDCFCRDIDVTQTHLVDAYLQGLVGHLPLDTQAVRPVVLFINGEYWGIHHLRERYDQHLLALRHDLDPDDVVVLEWDLSVAVGEPEDAHPFRQLLDYLAGADPSLPETLAEVEQRLDVGNFIDYLSLQVFSANTDWPLSNARMWRDRSAHGPGFGDGRWRWLVYDLDFFAEGLTMNVEQPQLRRLAEKAAEPGAAAIPFLFDRLSRNDEFVERFVTRFADLLNTAFEPARTTQELRRLESLLSTEMPHHIDRWMWGLDGSMDRWRADLWRVEEFMIERTDEQRRQLAAFYGLAEAVPVAVATSGDGLVRANTVVIGPATPGVADPSAWTGWFFPELTLALEALPADGHRFAGWRVDGVAAATSSTLAVEPTEGAMIEAIFEPDT